MLSFRHLIKIAQIYYKVTKIQPQILFVTGVGRSGTTLLQSMLHAHPHICSIPESKFVKRYVIPEYYQANSKISEGFFRNAISNNETLSRLKLPIEVLVEGQIKQGAINFLHFYRTIIEEVSKQNREAFFILDKDPLFINYPTALEKLFPNAKLIQIIRDPRDVILSRMKSKWGKSQTFLTHLFETMYGFEQAIHFGKEVFKDRFHSLKYEQLIISPKPGLEKACTFLKIDFDEAMLQYQTASGSLLSDKEKSWKGNVTKALMQKNTNKWRTELPLYQIKLIELLMKDHISSMRYELSGHSGGLLILSRPIFMIIYRLYTILKNLRIKKW